MKILYVIHQYWPRYQAGSENYTHYLAKAMADLGNDVFIVAVEPQSHHDYSLERYEEDGVHVIKIHKSVKISAEFDGHYEDCDYEIVFADLLEEISPSVVHIQHLMYTSLNIVKMIKEKNIPILYTLHDLWIECLRITKLDYKNRVCDGWDPEKCMRCYQSTHVYLKNKKLTKMANVVNAHLKGTPLYGWMARWVQKIINIGNASSKNATDLVQGRFMSMKEMVSYVDLFISPSEFLRQSFIAWGIDASKIVYSRNGMHIMPNDVMDGEKMSKDNDVLRFVFTSQVREHKGVDVLLDAFEVVGKKINNVELLIYGKYDERSIYGRNFVKRVDKIRNVTYKGAFNNTEINTILQGANYLVLPSIWPENAPLVIEEAYLNHVPCIVSNIGGMAERVADQENGLHFRVGDAYDLAEKIMHVAKNPQLQQEFIARIPHVKTIEENAEELMKIYSEYAQKNNVIS